MTKVDKTIMKQRLQAKKLNSLFGNNKRIAEIISDDDNFDLEDIASNPFRNSFLRIHEILVNKFVIDLKKPISKFISKTQNGSYEEINTYFDNRLLQIMRIRMILMPEFQKSVQTHTTSGHKYLVLKILWLDELMRKKITFSISLGNVEQVGFEINSEKPEIKQAQKDLILKLITLYNVIYTGG
jgi:hypothetical protein